jgi:hypothetical protein
MTRSPERATKHYGTNCVFMQYIYIFVLKYRMHMHLDAPLALGFLCDFGGSPGVSRDS